MLTVAQRAARAGKITASFVPALVAGDEAAITAKYLELIGDPSYVPENLDDDWPVQLGSFLEPFVLDWHERRTRKRLTRRGEVVVHPGRPWLACTLDAYRESDRTVIDAKVCHGQQRLENLVAYYTPQLVIQRACVGADYAALLIVHGGAEPQELDVFITPDYEARILETVDAFWDCVENRTPPYPRLPPPVPPERWRKIDLDRDAPNWGADMLSSLERWAGSHAAAAEHEEAKKSVKAILPDDVGEVRAGHYHVTRRRDRAVLIKFKP